MKIEEKIFQAINPTIQDLGFEIVDIEFSNPCNVKTLTIYIDIPRGVTLDDCELVQNSIDAIMDDIDPTNGQPYNLNISSPGLDRPFKKHRDYERNYGKEVEIKLFAPIKGKKLYEGILISHSDNVVVISIDDEEMHIETNKIAVTRPLVRFD